jgi:RNA polymerase sigma-70 factor, ECF subfamily
MPSQCQEPSSEQLAQQCQSGCSESFELLIGLHADRIYTFMCHMVGNPTDAEDLTQETFVKVYQSLERYDPNCAFTPWLFTIARRTAATFHRQRVHHEPLPDEIGADDEHPDQALEQTDLRNSLWQYARKLKHNQYEALWLRYGEGFSVIEVARIMRTNSLYVRVLLHRARSRLAKTLSQAGFRFG